MHHCHHRPADADTDAAIVYAEELCRSSNSRSGFQGVYPHGAGQWRVEYNREHYGVYSTPEEAAQIYRQAKEQHEAMGGDREYYDEPARGSTKGLSGSNGWGPKTSSQNRSGYKGVYPAENGRWKVEVNRRYRGTFDTSEEAAAFYEQVVASEGIGNGGVSAKQSRPAPVQQQQYDLYCDWCGTGFLQQAKLEVHEDTCLKRKEWLETEAERVKAAERPPTWPCEQCGEEFDSKYTLARHYITAHTKATSNKIKSDEEISWEASQELGNHNRRRTRSATEIEDLVMEMEDEQEGGGVKISSRELAAAAKMALKAASVADRESEKETEREIRRAERQVVSYQPQAPQARREPKPQPVVRPLPPPKRIYQRTEPPTPPLPPRPLKRRKKVQVKVSSVRIW